MTLKEKFLISFFEGLMENDFEELYSEDTDYEGNVKTENLQGQTNITLVTNEQEIQKNKYEVLNINFIN